MLFAVAALSVLALTFFVYGLAYKDVKKQEQEYNVKAIQIAGPPSIFCEEVGCFYPFEHSGCCQNVECDICAQWGRHDVPVLISEYVGKHRA